MYATTTDWSFEEWTDEHQKLLEEKYLPMFKSVGALNPVPAINLRLPLRKFFLTSDALGEMLVP